MRLFLLNTRNVYYYQQLHFSPVPQNGERGFFELEMPIPESFLTESDEVVVKFEANKGTPNPGLYYLRLVEGK